MDGGGCNNDLDIVIVLLRIFSHMKNCTWFIKLSNHFLLSKISLKTCILVTVYRNPFQLKTVFKIVKGCTRRNV